jgi:hypothetical protein
MKKILTIIAIASIALTSTFAVSTTDTNNIVINGQVTESPYSFALIYNAANADTANEALQSKVFDLSVTDTQSTDIFYLQRSNGNLNNDLLVAVDITARPFEGEVNGSNVKTAIIPSIALNNESGNGYTDIKNRNNDNRNKKVFNVTIPYGYHNDADVEIASFILNINGDAATDAGTYTSDVVINYTYDQI